MKVPKLPKTETSPVKKRARKRRTPNWQLEITASSIVGPCAPGSFWNRRYFMAGEKGEVLCMTKGDTMWALNPDTMAWYRFFRQSDITLIQLKRSSEPVYGLAFHIVTYKDAKGQESSLMMRALEALDVASNLD